MLEAKEEVKRRTRGRHLPQRCRDHLPGGGSAAGAG